MERQKMITISILAVVALGAALGYFYFKNKKSSAPDAQSAVPVATQGVPSIGEASNPLSNKPDINPTSRTNPFDSVKTNPFD